MLTRAGVAKRLGRSLATVRRMEGTDLHPDVDDRGIHRFDPAEVEEVARRDSSAAYSSPCMGEITAQDGEHDAAHAAAKQRISELETRVRDADEEVQRASGDARRAARERDDMKATALEALGLVVTLLEGDVPLELRRAIRHVRSL